MWKLLQELSNPVTAGVVLFILAAALAALSVPLARWAAFRAGAVDHPGGRRIHQAATPRLGGAAIFIGFAAAVFLFTRLAESILNPELSDLILKLMALSCVAMLVGLWDDLKRMSSRTKLAVQILLSLVAYSAGFRIASVSVGPGYDVILGWASLPLTVLWITGVMNAVNLVDGVDGLAAGISAIAFAAIALVSWRFGTIWVTAISAFGFAACAAFLPFNFARRKIFMGDSGSMFLGFILAVLAISTSYPKGPVPIYVPLFCLAYPLVDTTVAVLRRSIRTLQASKAIAGETGSSPPPALPTIVKQILTADGDHIHHRMLAVGFSTRKVVTVLYTVSLASCAVSYMLTLLPAEIGWLLCLFCIYVTSHLVSSLGYIEFAPKSVREENLATQLRQSLGDVGYLASRVKRFR